MRYPRCQIVTAPEMSAQVLVDLNQGAETVALDGDSKGSPLGVPDLEKGTRTVTLALVIHQESESSVVEIARAARRASDAFLLWQRSESANPVWLKLTGGAGGALDMKSMYADRDGCYRWQLDLEAEALTYGARVSETLDLRYREWTGVDNDVLARKLEQVKGDAPARCRVEVKPNGSMSGWSPWLSVAATLPDAWYKGPVQWQAEAFAPGSGYTREEISFGGPDPTTGNPYNVLKTNGTQNTQYGGAPCLSGQAPSAPDPGRYVMMIRLITGYVGAIAPSFRWGITAGPNTMYGMWRTWRKPAKSGQFAGWLALDAFSFPAGMDSSGIASNEVSAPTLTLWHQGDGVDANTYVDRVLLIPAELAQGAAYNLQALAPHDQYGAASNSTLRFDDLVERVGVQTRIDNPPRWFNTTPPKVTGGYPCVTPGFDNWVTLIPNVDTLGGDDASGADQFDVVVSYHPRYLHLAGD